jgi:2-iminobutanoate/2-iminopropanoate deaminase
MNPSNRAWQPIALRGDGPAPAGAYSPAVRAGDFVYVSGQVPRDPRTGETVAGGVEAQTRQTLANVRAVLESAGATLDDVVSVTAYLDDPDDWGKFNEVYKEVFREPYPTRTAVGAKLRGFLVEVTVTAYAPAARGH